MSECTAKTCSKEGLFKLTLYGFSEYSICKDHYEQAVEILNTQRALINDVIFKTGLKLFNMDSEG